MAVANLTQTQDEYNRLSEMYKCGSISESDFTKISTALQVANSQQRLQAKNLKETKLYVSFDGMLLKRLAETGEIVNVGIPLFMVSEHLHSQNYPLVIIPFYLKSYIFLALPQFFF